MPSTLDTLIGRIADDQLRADLRAAITDLRKVTDFGLVFEAHLPETVRLPHHSIRRGVNVTLRDLTDQSMFEVVSVNKDMATIRRLRHPEGSALSRQDEAQGQLEQVTLSSLVALAEFGDPIYPGMRHLGSLQRGGDKAAHVVINGENHHVLEALQFTHAGKIDCIYIDPPYNSGARDWKYNNNYVDAEDGYRHSKWLAFMNRRLHLAKQLLNPDDSVLIVTIDEKEVHRLVLLLEQNFATGRIQIISTLVNPAYVARKGAFGRSDEYIVFVMLGGAGPARLRLPREWVSSKGRTHTGNVRWDLLRRSSTNAERKHSPGCFYPIYVDPDGPRVAMVGDPLPAGISAAKPVDGLVPVLPIRKDGSEGNWQWSPKTFKARGDQGRVRITGSVGKGFVVSVLKEGEYQKIERGDFDVIGKRADGSLVVADVETDEVLATPSTQWRIASHDATQYGSRLLAQFLPGRKFPFPKSLYAVEDTLRFFVGDNPDAIVLDFFAGSGTTAQAVMRLNRQDGGHRQSISVTNNEVSEAEASDLRRKAHRPGDPEWEALGIFQHVTRPRITAAITGLTPEGDPVAGEYKFVDAFPMDNGLEENVEFFELTYLDAAQIEVDLAFAGIAPLLWLRAGGRGSIIGKCLDAAGRRKPYAWTDQYGVLFNTDRWRSFVSKLPDTATTAYIVTDSITEFANIAGELPGHLDVVRLYERYLTTFTVNGR
jgi:adenine-specific DNA-methyltransferase